MSYLLDTHTLLWWFSDPSQISKKSRNIIANSDKIIYVSSVTTWEIVIKKSLAKLKVPNTIFDLIFTENFQELTVTIEHTKKLAELPKLHNDPFDRLLIAQAIVENSIILTRDKMIPKYDVKVIKV